MGKNKKGKGKGKSSNPQEQSTQVVSSQDENTESASDTQEEIPSNHYEQKAILEMAEAKKFVRDEP